MTSSRWKGGKDLLLRDVSMVIACITLSNGTSQPYSQGQRRKDEGSLRGKLKHPAPPPPVTFHTTATHAMLAACVMSMQGKQFLGWKMVRDKYAELLAQNPPEASAPPPHLPTRGGRERRGGGGGDNGLHRRGSGGRGDGSESVRGGGEYREGKGGGKEVQERVIRAGGGGGSVGGEGIEGGEGGRHQYSEHAGRTIVDRNRGRDDRDIGRGGRSVSRSRSAGERGSGRRDRGGNADGRPYSNSRRDMRRSRSRSREGPVDKGRRSAGGDSGRGREESSGAMGEVTGNGHDEFRERKEVERCSSTNAFMRPVDAEVGGGAASDEEERQGGYFVTYKSSSRHHKAGKRHRSRSSSRSRSRRTSDGVDTGADKRRRVSGSSTDLHGHGGRGLEERREDGWGRRRDNR